MTIAESTPTINCVNIGYEKKGEKRIVTLSGIWCVHRPCCHARFSHQSWSVDSAIHPTLVDHKDASTRLHSTSINLNFRFMIRNPSGLRQVSPPCWPPPPLHKSIPAFHFSRRRRNPNNRAFTEPHSSLEWTIYPRIKVWFQWCGPALSPLFTKGYRGGVAHQAFHFLLEEEKKTSQIFSET